MSKTIIGRLMEKVENSEKRKQDLSWDTMLYTFLTETEYVEQWNKFVFTFIRGENACMHMGQYACGGTMLFCNKFADFVFSNFGVVLTNDEIFEGINSIEGLSLTYEVTDFKGINVTDVYISSTFTREFIKEC